MKNIGDFSFSGSREGEDDDGDCAEIRVHFSGWELPKRYLIRKLFI
jgi:hypothetical protein